MCQVGVKAEDGLREKGRWLWAEGRPLLMLEAGRGGYRFEGDPSGRSAGGGRGLLGSERLC